MTGPKTHDVKRRTVLATAAVATAAGALAPVAAHADTKATPSATAAAKDKPKGKKPTIVLVHGAFADASGWRRHRAPPAQGYTVPRRQSAARH